MRDDAGTVIAISSWTPRPFPDDPGEPACSCAGWPCAASIADSASARRCSPPASTDARSRGFRLVWANARDTALDFYVAHGFAVVGDGFLTTDTDLPHHRIVKRL